MKAARLVQPRHLEAAVRLLDTDPVVAVEAHQLFPQAELRERLEGLIRRAVLGIVRQVRMQDAVHQVEPLERLPAAGESIVGVELLAGGPGIVRRDLGGDCAKGLEGRLGVLGVPGHVSISAILHADGTVRHCGVSFGRNGSAAHIEEGKVEDRSVRALQFQASGPNRPNRT
jgi:hypothetical protein